MKGRQRQLVFHRGEELYIFRWEGGREEELIAALLDQMRDGRVGLDRCDVAVIHYQLTRAELALPCHCCRRRCLPPPSRGTWRTFWGRLRP